MNRQVVLNSKFVQAYLCGAKMEYAKVFSELIWKFHHRLIASWIV